jgi:hypothetical protein
LAATAAVVLILLFIIIAPGLTLDVSVELPPEAAPGVTPYGEQQAAAGVKTVIHTLQGLCSAAVLWSGYRAARNIVKRHRRAG